MDADFTTGPGDSRPARQPGYRLTHPDTQSPGTSPNPVLTGIDTGSYAGPGRNGQEQAVQWSTAPVTLRATPEPDALPRRIAPDLPQRTADPEAVAARLAADSEPFSARITTDSEPLAMPATNGEPFAVRPATNGSPYARSVSDSGSFTSAALDSEPYAAAPVADNETIAVRPAANGSPFAAHSGVHEDVFAASRPADLEAPTGRRHAPDPEPPARLESPARMETPARMEDLEAVAASLRESAPASPAEPERPASVKSRRRAAPEPAVAQQDSTTAATRAGAEFRTGDATIDLHHIMRLLVASHDLDVAAAAVESGEITVAELADVARRTRTAAVELVAAWYGGADHMRKFGEVLLQAAAETA
ncbi:hypothetical protein [Nocardia sp. NPDC059239]|uniref:hypothetical protein n=1 Tax=unclassified Nocardia TaxID=2637762 RepID=UPI00369FAD2F